MARNRSTNRRRRRGRFSFLMKLLCILLIAGAVVAALTIFFKVQSITVSGRVSSYPCVRRLSCSLLMAAMRS